MQRHSTRECYILINKNKKSNLKILELIYDFLMQGKRVHKNKTNKQKILKVQQLN